MASLSVDIMAINETWLRAGEEARAPVVPGYRLRHVPRPVTVRGGRGGGVGFYIRRGVTVRVHSHPTDATRSSVEQMWITLKVNGKKIAIGTAYRPPWLNVDLFLDSLTDSINSVSCFDSIIVLGDFNIDMLNINDIKTKTFNNMLLCLSLKQVVTVPTHFTDSSQTLIDVVCTNIPVKRVIVESVTAQGGHSVVICELKVKRDKMAPRTVTYRPIKNICLSSFKEYLNTTNWIDDIKYYIDVNEMVIFFSTNIIKLFDVYAPMKTVAIRDRGHPWITDNIKLMMRLRNEALNSFRKTKLESKKDYYKSLKTLVTRSLFFEKLAYYKQNINSKISQPKVLWKNLKSILLPKSKETELPSLFNDADKINDNFLKVPGLTSVSISLLTFYEYHRLDYNISFKLSLIKTNDIYKIMKILKSNAVGYDGITLDMIMMTLPQTLEALTKIINTSIRTSSFPDLWKIAIVRPLPKNNSPVQLTDLRPISILPCASKILEKVVCNQLSLFLEKNNILPCFQSGFRKQRSTTTALLDVTDNILAAQDHGMCTLLVLLDFSRAFDCINISLLLSKLAYYGFDHASIKWFHSYLSNRFQLVELRRNDGNKITSTIKSVVRGVPQGSILGPILFSLYCADIINSIKKCKYHIYADDTQLYISFKPSALSDTLADLNEDLKNVVSWSNLNCLVLNPDKTKFMLFGSKAQLADLPEDIRLTLMGKSIERVYEARNLGLYMDAELRFENHVIDSIKNCFFRLKTLYKLRPFLSEELRVQLVESLVLSRLNYVDIVYGPRLLSRTQKLIQRLQNACARFCFKIPLRSHVQPFLNKHYMLKMKSRRKFHLACLLFEVVNTKHPVYLSNKLKWVSDGRQCSRRQCSIQLSVPHHRTTAFRGSFRYSATKCWNNIPPPIRQLKTLPTFRLSLKKFLLNQQSKYECINADISYL